MYTHAFLSHILQGVVALESDIICFHVDVEYYLEDVGRAICFLGDYRFS
jgi:hypothetical protein